MEVRCGDSFSVAAQLHIMSIQILFEGAVNRDGKHGFTQIQRLRNQGVAAAADHIGAAGKILNKILLIERSEAHGTFRRLVAKSIGMNRTVEEAQEFP